MNKLHTYLFVVAVATGPVLAEAETVTKRVDLEGIKHVHLMGTYHLQVTQGDDEFIQITADSQELKQVKAKVQGSKLVLGEGNDEWNWQFSTSPSEVSDNNPQFELQVKELHSLSNLGVGHVVVKNIASDEDLTFSNLGAGEISLRAIEADDIEFNNLGAGRITVNGLTSDSIKENSTGAGRLQYDNVVAEKWEINSLGNSRSIVNSESRTNELEITIKGAGEVDAELVRSEKAQVELSGASVARVNVSDELDVEIDGVGKLYYRGSPKIDKKLSKVGELIAIDQ